MFGRILTLFAREALEDRNSGSGGGGGRGGGGGAALVVLAGAGYLVYEFIIKPYLAVKAYLGQFFGEEIPTGLAYPAIPGFMVLILMAMIASLVVWLFYYFNKFPNYASRAILGFSIGMFVIFMMFNGDILGRLGPLTTGYSKDSFFFMFLVFFSFSLLSWIYFALSRHYRYQAKNIDFTPNFMRRDPLEIEGRKVVISAFLNRRVNLGFLCMLLLFVVFDPNLWPDIPLEIQFWRGVQYIPELDPPEVQYYANLNATPYTVLHTIATYLFFAYFVITLQLRAAHRLKVKESYAGYIPPYYVYSLGVVGTFCACVFAFVPYEYMGKKNLFLQAVAPLTYFSISLIRTGWQYTRFLNVIERKKSKSTVPAFNAKKSLLLIFGVSFSLVTVCVFYMYFYGLKISFDSNDIRLAINDDLPKRFRYFTFREVEEFTLLPQSMPVKDNDRTHFFYNRFEMKVVTDILPDGRYGFDTVEQTTVKLKGDIVFYKRYETHIEPSEKLILKNLEVVEADLSVLDDAYQGKRRSLPMKYLKRSAMQLFGKTNSLQPTIFYSLITKAKVSNNEIIMRFKLD